MLFGRFRGWRIWYVRSPRPVLPPVPPPVLTPSNRPHPRSSPSHFWSVGSLGKSWGENSGGKELLGGLLPPGWGTESRRPRAPHPLPRPAEAKPRSRPPASKVSPNPPPRVVSTGALITRETDRLDHRPMKMIRTTRAAPSHRPGPGTSSPSSPARSARAS